MRKFLPLGLLIVMLFPLRSVQAAAIIVNTTYDSVDIDPGDGECLDKAGDCSLRAAIMEANARPGIDTIRVPTGEHFLLIAGKDEDDSALGDLDITGSVTIIGDGAQETIINAVELDRVIHVMGSGTRVAFNSVTITNGEPDTSPGGNILIDGATVFIANSVVNNSISPDGGCIYNNNGTLTLFGVDVINCIAPQGGGITNSGLNARTIIRSTTLTENWSYTGGGGAILNQGGHVVIEGSEFIHNWSVTDDGGAVANYAGVVEINSSTFEENLANATISGRGGAIFNADGTVSIKGSSLRLNEAHGGGGAIYSIGGAVRIEQTTIGDNIAQREGGGIYGQGSNATLTNSTIENNISYELGGGLVNRGGRFTLTSITVQNNAAFSTGGGLFNTGAVDLVNTSFISNTANQSGAAVQNEGGTLSVNATCYVPAPDLQFQEPLPLCTTA